jgi:sugar lactone lactonase YvrE
MSPAPQLLRLLLYVLLLFSASTSARSQIYVTSQQTQEILSYSLADGSFDSVFAMTITEGFRNPGTIAYRASDGALFVSSISTGEVWSYSTSTGDASPPALTTSLIAPIGIALDGAATHLYVADPSDSEANSTDSIKQIENATGTVSVVGTNNQADLLAVAVRGGDVYASDVGQDRVLRFPIAGGPSSVEISSGLSEPSALLFLGANTLLIADTDNDRVVEYSDSGGSWAFVREVLSASAGVTSPTGLALAPDGRLTVTGRGSGDAVLVDLGTLVVSPFVAAGTGGLSDPVDVTWTASTAMIASRAGNSVLFFDSVGQPTGIRAEGLSASLDSGIELSPDGARLFVSSISSNDVIEFDRATGAKVQNFNQVCPNLPLPFDVVIGPGGDLYVSCTLNSSVERFDGTLGTALGSFVLAGSAGLSLPRSLAFGPGGDLFVANGSGAVMQFDGPTGVPVGTGTFIDTNANGGGPLDARDLTFEGGVLYVVSGLYEEVLAFDAATGAFLSVFVSAGSGGLSGPTAGAFDAAGDFLVASQNDHSIRRYDGSTGAYIDTFVASGSGGLDAPVDLALYLGAATPVPALGSNVRVALGALLVWTALGGVNLLVVRTRVQGNRTTGMRGNQ